MDRYIIKSEHTAEDCRAAVKHFMVYHKNFLTHFEWGCKDDDHTAYAIIEAESHEHALMSVPPAMKDKARAIKLTTFGQKGQTEKVHSKAS